MAAIAALVGLAGCTEVRDGLPPTETERAASLGLVDQMSALRRLADDPTDRGVLLDAVRFDAAAALLDINVGDGLAPEWPAVPRGVAMPDCITASLTTATFTECTLDGGHVVDGTIARAGPRVNAEVIDVFILDAGVEGAATIDGALSLTPRLIDGSVDLDASWSRDGNDYLLDATLAFDAVALDDTGCPIAGAATITGSVSTLGAPASRTVQFGPACGDVTISR